MKKSKLIFIIYFLIIAAAVTLFAVYSHPITKAVAPIVEFTVKLFL